MRHTNALLYLDGITVSFDGFRALDGLSLVVDEGELRAVIGPNGAGKTTMMDVVTGRVRPQAGTALFAGSLDLARAEESAIARAGIARKFQKPSIFEALTVGENLQLAADGDRGPLSLLRGSTGLRVGDLLDRIGLGELADVPAARLSHGQRQWLEIGMLLARDARLLLLDEPVAGMTDAETERTAALLREIAGERAVVVVEHDMVFVSALQCKVTVLHEGRVLTEGPMHKVAADPRVVEVYLGERPC